MWQEALWGASSCAFMRDDQYVSSLKACHQEALGCVASAIDEAGGNGAAAKIQELFGFQQSSSMLDTKSQDVHQHGKDQTLQQSPKGNGNNFVSFISAGTSERGTPVSMLADYRDMEQQLKENLERLSAMDQGAASVANFGGFAFSED